MLSNKLMMGAAVFFTLGGMGISNLGPLPQTPTPAPVEVFQASSTPTLIDTIQPGGPPLSLTTALPAISTPVPANSPASTDKRPTVPIKGPTPTPMSVSLNTVKIYFFSVGLGDSFLIIGPDGKTMLIDGGPADSGIVDHLRAVGIKKIDVMVATHPHQDHVGGLAKVLGAFPVKKLYTNGETKWDEPAYVDFRAAVTAAKVKSTRLVRGNKISLGALSFQVLNPIRSLPGNINENAMVLRFTYQKTTVIFMSDVDQDTEGQILAAKLPVKADIYKIGHHGDSTSSSVKFIKAVSPSTAIYSCGPNPFGLPEQVTLNRFTNLGIKLYGTDRNGSILVTIDPNGYKIDTDIPQ